MYALRRSFGLVSSKSFAPCGFRCFSTPKMPEFDWKPPKYEGLSRDEVLDMRKKYVSPGVMAYYKNPVMIVDGKMQYLFDGEGRRYLDMFAGIVTCGVGHCHPEVLKAAYDQMARLQHTTCIYLNQETSLLAKELAEKMPKGSGLTVTIFTNSGSEANDLAVLMAREATGNSDIIGLRNCYHGTVGAAHSLTAFKSWRFPSTSSWGIKHAACPDTLRGPFKKDDPEAGKKYAEDVRSIIDHTTSGGVAGFIAETYQGVGGTVCLADNYLPHAYQYVREAGGLCIADEVQGGFGRTGTDYWSFENQGVVPDIVTMAKSLGNGAPIGAVTTTPKIAAAMGKRLFFNTFGGNPVSCAMARAVIRIVDQEGLQQQCLEKGEILMKGLEKLKSKYPNTVADVRGRGLLLGIEFVKSAETLEPAIEDCADIFERAKDLGVLFGKGGLYGTAIRLKPPICLTKEDCHFAIDVLDQAIQDVVG